MRSKLEMLETLGELAQELRNIGASDSATLLNAAANAMIHPSDAALERAVDGARVYMANLGVISMVPQSKRRAVAAWEMKDALALAIKRGESEQELASIVCILLTYDHELVKMLPQVPISKDESGSIGSAAQPILGVRDEVRGVITKAIDSVVHDQRVSTDEPDAMAEAIVRRVLRGFGANANAVRNLFRHGD